MISLQEKVAAKIATIAPVVEEKIIDALVSREVARRSDALTKVIDALSKKEGDRRKIKPDMVTHNEDGTVKDQAYSKVKTEEIKKLDQQVLKHTNAINKALDKADYGDVYNLASGNEDKSSGNNQKSGGDEGQSEAA